MLMSKIATRGNEDVPVARGEVSFSKEARLGQVICLVNGHHHCQGLAGPGVPVQQLTSSNPCRLLTGRLPWVGALRLFCTERQTQTNTDHGDCADYAFWIMMS